MIIFNIIIIVKDLYFHGKEHYLHSVRATTIIIKQQNFFLFFTNYLSNWFSWRFTFWYFKILFPLFIVCRLSQLLLDTERESPLEQQEQMQLLWLTLMNLSSWSLWNSQTLQRAGQDQRKGVGYRWNWKLGMRWYLKVIKFTLRDLVVELPHVFPSPVSNTD